MSAMAFFRDGRPAEDYLTGHGYRVANSRPRIECADGFSLSVQAGKLLYSTPRWDEGPWSAVEVGFPSERPEPWEEWQQYVEDADRPTDTVYAYVPLGLVEALVELHGGEKS